MILAFEKSGLWITLSLFIICLGVPFILYVLKKLNMNVKSKYLNIGGEYKRKTDTLHKNQVKIIIYAIRDLQEQIEKVKLDKRTASYNELNTLLKKCHDLTGEFICQWIIDEYKDKNTPIKSNIRKSYEYILVMSIIYKADEKNSPLMIRDIEQNGFSIFTDEEFKKYKESHIYDIITNTKMMFKEDFNAGVIDFPESDIEKILSPTGYILTQAGIACGEFYDNLRSHSVIAAERTKAIEERIKAISELNEPGEIT